MEISRITPFELIYENKEISELLGTIIFNPTFGKIQNIAQSLYAKTQGRFYVIKSDGLLIGLMGLSKIDNHKLVVNHFAVKAPFQRHKIGTALLTGIIEAEGVSEVVVDASEEDMPFYKGFGFKIQKSEFEEARGRRFYCVFLK